jgi:hypothetical protein
MESGWRFRDELFLAGSPSPYIGNGKEYMAGRKTRTLDQGYESEVDRVDEPQWNQLELEFDDCNLNQTWAYGAAMSGRWNSCHLVLRYHGEVVALAEARVVRLPLIRCGLAYVSWGPIWQRKGQKRNVEHFRHAVRALRNEFVCRRGLILRIFPLAFDDDAFSQREVLEEEGFRPAEKEQGDRTLLIDLSPSLDELRSGFEANWRRWLRMSEKNDLEYIEGAGGKFFDEFMGLYNEMVERKDFAASNNVLHLRQIQEQLPDPMKLRILLCRSQGKVCAGMVVSSLGSVGFEIAAASNELARHTQAAYFLRWKLLEVFKNEGCILYNLNGINPEGNPGTYHFKRGLAGKKGRDVYYLGKFDVRAGFLGDLLMKLASYAKKTLPGLRNRLAAFRTAKS